MQEQKNVLIIFFLLQRKIGHPVEEEGWGAYL